VAGEVALDARDLLPGEEVAGLEAGLDDLREVREQTAAAVVADEGERPLPLLLEVDRADVDDRAAKAGARAPAPIMYFVRVPSAFGS
jgi:hypothetical protein